MGPTLSNFSSVVRRHNVARPNLFYINITLPPALVGVISAEELNVVNLMCHTTYLPEISFETHDNYYEAGQPRPVVHGYSTPATSFIFTMDGSFIVKKFFDMWRRTILKGRSTYEWADSYTAESIILTQVNLDESIVNTTEFKRIYLKSVMNIGLFHGDHGTKMDLNVAMAYERLVFSTDTNVSDAMQVIEQRKKLADKYRNKELVQDLEVNPRDRR